MKNSEYISELVDNSFAYKLYPNTADILYWKYKYTLSDDMNTKEISAEDFQIISELIDNSFALLIIPVL